MRVLTNDNIQSLRMRGYIQRDVNYQNSDDFDVLHKLSVYSISPEPYLLLFNGIDDLGLRNLMRNVCLNWQNVAQSLNDTPLQYQSLKHGEICAFFVDIKPEDKTVLSHRVYFFVEMVYQYFFP